MSESRLAGQSEPPEVPREPTPGWTRVLQWLGMVAAVALVLTGLWWLLKLARPGAG